MIKIILSVICLSLLCSQPVQSKCHARIGKADVAWGLVYRFIDTNCDGLWDTFQEVRITSKGWKYSKEKLKVPDKFRRIKLPEIPRKPRI